MLSFVIVGESCLFVYLHERPTEPAKTLLSVIQNAQVVSPPFEYTTDGTLEVTSAQRKTYETHGWSDHAAFQDAFQRDRFVDCRPTGSERGEEGT